MTDELFLDKLSSIDYSASRDKIEILDEIAQLATEHNYQVADTSPDKSWGGCLHFDAQDSERFAEEFFPELDLATLQLGDGPKIILVSPGERLHWQYHERRTKHWKFLTPGKYFTSQTDEAGTAQLAVVGTSLQVDSGQRHQLVGMPAAYVLVADVWQHTDSSHPSDSDDVVRLPDPAS